MKTTKANIKLIAEISKKLGIKEAECTGETDDTLTFSGIDTVSGERLTVVIKNIVIKHYAPVTISVAEHPEVKSVKTEVLLDGTARGATSMKELDEIATEIMRRSGIPIKGRDEDEDDEGDEDDEDERRGEEEDLDDLDMDDDDDDDYSEDEEEEDS